MRRKNGKKQFKYPSKQTNRKLVKTFTVYSFTFLYFCAQIIENKVK